MARESLKILIVEDDEDDAFFIKDILKEGLGEPAPLIDHYSSIGSSLERRIQLASATVSKVFFLKNSS